MPAHFNTNILIAVDDSEASDRAVRYVGHIIGARKEFHVLLLHVTGPMPPRLLEFGGSEHPIEERRGQASLRAGQDAWVEETERAVQPIFTRAKAILREAQVPEAVVTTRLGITREDRDVDASILEAAHAEECDTIVVGRNSFSWLQELFRQHVSDKLLEEDHNLALWVVQ